MASLLRRPRLCIPVVLTAAIGWIALSNHCALAVLQQGDAQRAMSCHDSRADKDVPAQNRHSDIECCKVIRAALFTPEKNVASLDELLVAPCKDLVALLMLPDAGEEGALLEWDTGPPGALSFSESVLQQSILAHAPPFPT